MLPTRLEAERLLAEAEACNPGPWGDHSRITAHCAEKIATKCKGLDSEKAYILGLLHDIGRKCGTRHLGHVTDGFQYMKSLGYHDAARICMTHSFNNKRLEEYIGKFDTTEEETELITVQLIAITFDDYDRLIQLCDALAGSKTILDIEARMNDVKARYGYYPQAKWVRNLQLKAYFEALSGIDIYTLVEKDSFHL